MTVYGATRPMGDTVSRLIIDAAGNYAAKTTDLPADFAAALRRIADQLERVTR